MSLLPLNLVYYQSAEEAPYISWRRLQAAGKYSRTWMSFSPY